MFRYTADSSCDRPEIPGMEIRYVPMIISTDERSYPDNEYLNVTEMLDNLSAHKGRSYTACPSVDGWLRLFEGGSEIFAVAITSGLSGSYNACMAAKDLYLQEHPDAKIAVFDTLSTGPENRLLLEKLKECEAAGMSFEETETAARAYLKTTRLFYMLQSLHNLGQNGRISKVAAAAVGVLGIRIVGTASPEGTLALLGKYRGDRRALPELINHLIEAGYKGGKLRICHVENPSLAEKLAAMVREKWPAADILTAPSSGLCSYYAERGGLLIGMES